jgi:hypothetical protein
MVVTAEMVSQVSEYVVDDGKIFTGKLFDYYKGIGEAILGADDPEDRLNEALYDYCHALLIAHLYAVKKGQTGYQSTSAQGYSVTRKLGETAYSIEYKNILQKFAGIHSSVIDKESWKEWTTRADANMPDFNLDQAEIPSFFDEVW